MAAPGATDQLVELRNKYDTVIRLMHARGVRVRTVEMQGGKLLLRADAPSEDVKNEVWSEIKRIDAGYLDLTADITVSAGTAPASAGQGGAASGGGASTTTYTVRKGDTLSKISQDVYGNAGDYRRIFEANRDQLKDADEIQPGQVLRIPAK
jgi:nucleoid-associated protein YgaU